MRRLFMTSVAVAALGASLCAQTEPPSDTGLAQQVVREIEEIKGGTTPAQWRQVHPDEKLQMFNGVQYANDTQRWCARTVVTYSATTGRAWTRSVYFYDPHPRLAQGRKVTTGRAAGSSPACGRSRARFCWP